MQISIKTSAANQAIVSNLTQKLPGGAKENIIARVALGYSLSTGKRFKQNEFSTYDSQGKEYKEHILFDSYKDFYVALICQAYGINKNNELIPKYVKLHIDHGLEAINYLFENRPQYTFFDFLIENLGKGIDAIEDSPVSLDAVKNNNQHIDKTTFTGPINIKIGYNPKTQEPITFCFNNTKIYNNQHIAVAGKSGSGKSQFALEFLRQLVAKTQGQVNFLFLDFKGVSNEDKKKMEGSKITDIHDLLALKIMVDEIENCYKTLYYIHSNYHPINDKFKDYICNPKTNMYRSLHTTVFGLDDRLVQTQIRTFDMDKVASFGLPAYWDIQKGDARRVMQEELKTKSQLFKSLTDINLMFVDNQDFVTQIKSELFSDKIYVYTSSGKVIELPKGSNVIDLACYTDLEKTLIGAKVNDEEVQLDHVLRNKDRVITFTSLEEQDRGNWIDKANTSFAKKKLKSFG